MSSSPAVWRSHPRRGRRRHGRDDRSGGRAAAAGGLAKGGHLRLERRVVLLPFPPHVLLLRYPRCLGEGLHREGAELGSHLTPSWREVDSNPRSPVKGPWFSFDVALPRERP